MNHYIAKQRVEDKRWDYTCNNHPIGYCRAYKEIDPKLIPISEQQQEEYRATQHKHHTDGHETEQEARECYKEYLLDHHLRLRAKMGDQQMKCRVCGEWTQNFAEIDCQMFVLCDKHNNRETVEGLFDAPWESWSSW